MIVAWATDFENLRPDLAYAIWKLRQDVFVVEQDCPYPDLDGRDTEPGTRHVILEVDDRMLGYARLLDDGERWRIGRVVLAPEGRGRGLADKLMQTTLLLCTDERDVVLDAQSPLAGWYATFGFVADGPEFVEDGIPHTPMRLSREGSSAGR